ncbi:MAG TPA: FecR family protein [Steroidobacteraceae bacterium]|nr:FecR family protein [Steroidobacteraceae bacterium]
MSGDRKPSADADALGTLIALAGPRSAPDEAQMAAARAVVEREWQRTVTRHRRRRYLLQAAGTAAMLAFVVGALTLWRNAATVPPMPTVFIGSRGPLQLAPQRSAALLQAGDALPPGTTLQTGAAAAALLKSGASSVRIGPQTRLRIGDSGSLELQQGRLYVDSGPEPGAASALRVRTPLGVVSHVGTQFQLQLDPAGDLVLAVREGRIELSGTGGSLVVHSGESLRVAAGGRVEHGVVTPYDASWQWVTAYVPDFAIAGRSLGAFLDWYLRETGRSLVLDGPLTREQIQQTTLSGSISGLTPDQALEAVVATTGLKYDLRSPGELRLSIRIGDSEHARSSGIAAFPGST